MRFKCLICILAVILAGCGTTGVPPSAFLMTGNLHQKCIEVLREGLHSDEFWSSIYAAETLIAEEYTFEAEPVLNEGRDGETDRRRIAGYARAMIKAGHKGAIVDLQDILLSDDTEARILAAEAMFRTASIGDPAILEQATDTLNDSRLRVFAAATLTVIERTDMLPAIRQALQSNDPAARYVAADVIPVVGNVKDDVPLLLDKKELARSDFETLYFVRALSIFGVASERGNLVAFLDHADPTIRSRAAFAIAESWIIEASDRLIAMLEDPSLAVRVRAAQALLTLSDPTSPYRYLGLRE